MKYRTLGRTGLKASIIGLGGGGPSRLGKGTKKSKQESITVVQQALESGINFIDTSEIYRTEPIIGEGIKGHDRESLILSTKKAVSGKLTTKNLEKSLNKSLKALGTDYLDIYHLHAVFLEDYEYLYSTILPKLIELKDEGTIRYIGITERFDLDTSHEMLKRAIKDDIWDVMMVGFNILNQSARDSIFPTTIKKNIGVLIMFAVRLALSKPERLNIILEELIERGEINPIKIDKKNPLQFLIHDNGAKSIMDAAYRFCLYEPGVHVVLTGTGNVDHLKENIESFYRPSLPDQDVKKLREIFKNVDSVSAH